MTTSQDRQSAPHTTSGGRTVLFSRVDIVGASTASGARWSSTRSAINPTGICASIGQEAAIEVRQETLVEHLKVHQPWHLGACARKLIHRQGETVK